MQKKNYSGVANYVDMQKLWTVNGQNETAEFNRI